jgi:glycosyltransferase involved in cell wall biosynthesis
MVSIVVPVYNVEKYLRQCVDSLLAQTYKDMEIILVDDGSTDSSGKICDEYAEKYDFIRALHKENAGLGLARNSGMDEAKGGYVSFVDSDDYLKPDAVERLINAMEKTGADTCIGGYTRVRDNGEVIFESAPAETACDTAEVFPRLMGSLPEKKDSFRPSVWNALYSMKIIRENNVRFPSEREYIAEDMVFDIDYYRYSKTVALVGSAGYCYRVTPGSLTMKYNPEKFEKSVFLFDGIFKRLKDRGWGEECVLRANRQFFLYIRACIRQQGTAISGKTKAEALESIRGICEDKFTRRCVENYPCEKMGFAQRFFLGLVKGKKVRLLYLLVCREKKSSKA